MGQRTPHNLWRLRQRQPALTDGPWGGGCDAYRGERGPVRATAKQKDRKALGFSVPPFSGVANLTVHLHEQMQAIPHTLSHCTGVQWKLSCPQYWGQGLNHAVIWRGLV